jgi:enoyl-CoA hydratase/carnithine racemase
MRLGARVSSPAQSQSFKTLEVEVSEAIATITLNRPEQLNALDPTMERELLGVWDLIDADDEIRAVVVTGAGRAFCAGFDLSEAGFDVVRAAELRGTEELAPGDLPRDSGGLIALRIFRCTKPVIAAINGAGVGFGATLPLPMDVRLASTKARFGFVFAKRGICLDAASSWFLPRAVGLSRSLEWGLSGRIFDADEALEAGLVRSLHEPDDLLPAARAKAQELIAESAPVSVAVNRALLWQMSSAPHPMEAHQIESLYIAQRAASADTTEGADAFLEKRAAKFPGKVGEDLPAGFPPRPGPDFDPRPEGWMPEGAG